MFDKLWLYAVVFYDAYLMNTFTKAKWPKNWHYTGLTLDLTVFKRTHR